MPKLVNLALLFFTSCYHGASSHDVAAEPANAGAGGAWVPMQTAAPAQRSGPLQRFTVRRSCETHGTGVSHRSVTVTDAPPRAEMRDEQGRPHVRTLVAADVAPLAQLLSGPVFDRLVTEKLPPAAKPVMSFRACTITVEAGGKVSTIEWAKSQQFSAASHPRFEAIMDQLTHLEQRAWRHR